MKKITLNRNKTKKGGSGAPRVLKTDIYTTIVTLSYSDGRYFYQFSGTALFSGPDFCTLGYR